MSLAKYYFPQIFGLKKKKKSPNVEFITFRPKLQWM